MGARWDYIWGMETRDPALGPFEIKSVKLPNVATASLPAAATGVNGNEGNIVYDATTSSIKFSDGSSWAAINAGGGANTLNAAYDQGGAGAGRSIDVDSGAVTLTVSDTDNNACLALVQNDTTNNESALTFANAGTGSDILGTGSLWSISSAGVAVFPTATITTANITTANITSMTLGSVDGFTLSGDCIFTTSATTGQGLLINGSSLTSGDVLRVEADAASLSGGNILNLTVDTVSVFDVDEDGSLTISGTASSDAITLTAGDISLSAGTVNVTANAGDAFDIINAAASAVFDINLAAASVAAGGLIDIDGSTGSAPVIEIAMSGAYTGDYLSLNMSNAVGAKAIDVTGAGVRTAALVHLTDTPEAAGAHSLQLDVTPGAGTLQVVDINVAGTDDADILSFDFAAAYTGDAINITTSNMGAAGQALVVDGTIANSGAIVNLSTSGISTAAGSVISAGSSTQPAAANVGVVGRFLETGAAQATTYAVQIDSTSNEALNVSTGRAHFAEAATFLGSNKVAVAANYVQAGGANNAITVAANADDTGTNIPLADGLKLIVDLGIYTLQAGANTLDYIGGGAVAIKVATNPANDLGTAYAANGVIELVYSSGATAWVCMAQ